MKKILTIATIFLAFGLFAGACGGDDPADNSNSVDTVASETGAECTVDGSKYEECKADGDESVCSFKNLARNKSYNIRCRLPDGRTCSTGSFFMDLNEQNSDQFCEFPSTKAAEGEAKADCEVDEDCPNGYFCQDGSCFVDFSDGGPGTPGALMTPIEICVYEMDGESPIENAVINEIANKEVVLDSVTTDSSGCANFQLATGDSYTVEASKAGFISRTASITATSANPVSKSIFLPEEMSEDEILVPSALLMKGGEAFDFAEKIFDSKGNVLTVTKVTVEDTDVATKTGTKVNWVAPGCTEVTVQAKDSAGEKFTGKNSVISAEEDGALPECAGGEGAVEDECENNSDCEEGEVCTDGECVEESGEPECEADEDCDEGEVCTDGVCVEEGAEPECAVDGDCDEGFVCTEGVCVEEGEEPECEVDGDCDEGFVCESGECARDFSGVGVDLMIGGMTKDISDPAFDITVLDKSDWNPVESPICFSSDESILTINEDCTGAQGVAVGCVAIVGYNEDESKSGWGSFVITDGDNVPDCEGFEFP